MAIKPISIDVVKDGWKKASAISPANIRELYIVVQNVGDELIRNAAWWQQDANGVWGWNKENISHWMEWPQMPSTQKN